MSSVAEKAVQPNLALKHDVVLRPLTGSDDLAALYRWRSDLAALPLWSLRRHPVSQEQFEKEFREQEASSTHVRMMVVSDSSLAGTVWTYNCSLLHGWAYLGLYIASEFRGQGVGPQAARTFVDWLFANYTLRKLYAEVYAFNKHSYKAWLAAGYEPVSVMPDHLYWQGEYHDLLIFSVTPDSVEPMAGLAI